MRDWFSWNGVRCTEHGMVVLNQPKIVRPLERTSTVIIPGRGGSLTLSEGQDIYDDITLACDCCMRDPFSPGSSEHESRIAQISGWLKGRGKVAFAVRTNGWYEGRVSNQIGFEKILRGNPHVSFQVQFRCSPYFYLTSGLKPVVMSNSAWLWNAGNVSSLPLITVRGTGDARITVVGDRILSVYLSDLGSVPGIVLDSDAKLAYSAADESSSEITLLGSRVSGDWPVFPAGTFSVLADGDISSIEIIPRWRCI